VKSTVDEKRRMTIAVINDDRLVVIEIILDKIKPIQINGEKFNILDKNDKKF